MAKRSVKAPNKEQERNERRAARRAGKIPVRPGYTVIFDREVPNWQVVTGALVGLFIILYLIFFIISFFTGPVPTRGNRNAPMTGGKLDIETITPGDGKTFPKPGDILTVHYTGQFEDGRVFDSSRMRGEPIQFQVGQGQVIRGWDEGLLKLSLGQRAKLTLSPEYAYGSRGAGDVIPPNAVLVFDVELLGINDNKVAGTQEKQQQQQQQQAATQEAA